MVAGNEGEVCDCHFPRGTLCTHIMLQHIYSEPLSSDLLSDTSWEWNFAPRIPNPRERKLRAVELISESFGDCGLELRRRVFFFRTSYTRTIFKSWSENLIKIGLKLIWDLFKVEYYSQVLSWNRLRISQNRRKTEWTTQRLKCEIWLSIGSKTNSCFCSILAEVKSSRLWWNCQFEPACDRRG